MISQTISHYRILNQLGAGGMGEVYLAEDTQLDRKVAIKFLPPESIADEQAKKRLVREARAAAKLDHPNICSIYEVGEEDGRSFIVMQYIEGETLASRIHREPLESKESLDIATQIADALAEAHAHNIIHRDIKPQNIMLTARGQVKVLDFGLARTVREKRLMDTEAETESLLTAPGLVVGTVPYMSPEQVRGEELDARSDIFSLGALLYEIVTGTQPFAAANAASTISTILTREPPPLARYSREVPAELERIVGKALRKDREQRYQTARDLRIDLKSLSEGLTFEAERKRSELTDVGSSPTAWTGGRQIAETAGLPMSATGDGVAAHTTFHAGQQIGGFRKHMTAFGAGILALIALAAIVIFLMAGGGKAIDSVAIMPFTNVGADPNTEYLSDGITESLISNLSRLANLKVMSHSSVFRYKGREIDPQAVGRDLKVRAVLTGRVVQRGDGLSISLELVDAQDNRQLWGEQYNRRLADVLQLQTEISREVSEKLRLKLTGEDQKRLAKPYTENTEAYQFYLKGRFYWSKFSEEGLKKAIEYFNQAIEADPNYALAYTGLANAYNVQGATGIAPPRDVWPKAKSALEKALAIDDTLAAAHSASGGMKLLFDWDWPGAERELTRAIQLNPNLADAHNLYGYYFQVIGRLDEATSEIKRAQELEPLSTEIGVDLASAYYYMRHYDAAIEQYRKTSELDPSLSPPPLFLLGQAIERKGMYDQAIAECQKALRIHAHDPAIVSVLGYVYAVSGRKSEAQKLLNELMDSWKQRYFSPIDVALVYTGLGDKDQAFAWLDRAYEARDGQLIWINVEPELDSLRSDARFTDLLRRIGIPR
jgi:TolB-like protein/Flp pilus assembly protein TadD/tRNA A-37 threonylcarbamoyl transferase component Bud32